MEKKTKIVVVTVLSLSIVIGCISGYAVDIFHKTEHSIATHNQITLEDEFHNVDLIVQGVVVEEGQSYVKKFGLGIPVTPATIQVNKVLFGNSPEGTIIFLQQGTYDDPEESRKFVKKSDELILILTRTIDGDYWSYNFDDGIWKVKDGKVRSDSTKELLNPKADEEQDINHFVKRITKAAKIKRKSVE